MAMHEAVSASGKFLKHHGRRAIETAAPQLQHEPGLPTARDYTTGGLAVAFTVIINAALHHGANIDLSPEVVAALTTVTGFLTARYFRY